MVECTKVRLSVPFALFQKFLLFTYWFNQFWCLVVTNITIFAQYLLMILISAFVEQVPKYCLSGYIVTECHSVCILRYT